MCFSLKLHRQAEYLYNPSSALKWHERKNEFLDVIMGQRLGINGLRPFGLNNVISKLVSKSKGSRISKVAADNNKKSALKRVFLKAKDCIDKESGFKHEIRRRHILQRHKYEMEFERDR